MKIDVNDGIPVLTDVVEVREPIPAQLSAEALSAVQADVSARVIKLAEELLHNASREMEAVLFERVCDALRAQLPELIDTALREHLLTDKAE